MDYGSDKVSLRLNQTNVFHSDVERLRYFSDYGHGFLGLFRALFDGKLEEVIRDLGPPFIAEEHIPMIMKSLLGLAQKSKYSQNIPKKYAFILEEPKVSSDSLFE